MRPPAPICRPWAYGLEYASVPARPLQDPIRFPAVGIPL